jgi:hypothetical protein
MEAYMSKLSRRDFLISTSLYLGAGSMTEDLAVASQMAPPTDSKRQPKHAAAPASVLPIDFRFTPASWQTAICFPDDHSKTLIGENGEFRFDYSRDSPSIFTFANIVGFSLAGMKPGKVIEQKLESPSMPIVRTHIEFASTLLHLTAFASNLSEEGRVDNVILEVVPKGTNPVKTAAVRIAPMVNIETRLPIKTKEAEEATTIMVGNEEVALLACWIGSIIGQEDTGHGMRLLLNDGLATPQKPARYFLRFPREDQSFERIKAGLSTPDEILHETRQYWLKWKPFGNQVVIRLSGRHHEFLLACARNIQQSREERDGKLTFQVGPTCYRGLWVVDGHFILEAARYLGYDAEVQQGLEATWERQEADGGIFAGGGREHWKDTGIAMFSLVRQAELSQDWDYFRQMQPQILRGVGFLKTLRDKARAEGSANGSYGLLARGFGDGGLGGGVRSEFTNTLWVLAGLRTVTDAASFLNLSGFEDAKQFYLELRGSFFQAARAEMRRHPKGFQYLPMLMKEDPEWTTADEWARPKPQMAQWALSHALYPGLVFERNDPVVKGHIALMQASTEEEVPIETGWIPHEGLWTYNAAFVAHAYLWAGDSGWARRTFIGFLNHATQLYCWREEQPLQNSQLARYVGDMPHNWASAECVLFLRHMLALEDGPSLRLLEGISEYELKAKEPWSLQDSPTRFGRISLKLEPLSRNEGWRLEFQRGAGPVPTKVLLPAQLGVGWPFKEIRGARSSKAGNSIQVTPDSLSWTATWQA